MSIRPGRIVIPGRSIRRAPSGIDRPRPAAPDHRDDPPVGDHHHRLLDHPPGQHVDHPVGGDDHASAAAPALALREAGDGRQRKDECKKNWRMIPPEWRDAGAPTCRPTIRPAGTAITTSRTSSTPPTSTCTASTSRPHLFEPLGTSDPLAPMIAHRPGRASRLRVPDSRRSSARASIGTTRTITARPWCRRSPAWPAPMIVYGAIDEVPEISAARDIPLVIQDIGLFPSDDRASRTCGPTSRSRTRSGRRSPATSPSTIPAPGQADPTTSQGRLHHRRLCAALLPAERRAVLQGDAQLRPTPPEPEPDPAAAAAHPRAARRSGALPHAQRLLRQSHADRRRRPRDAPARARRRQLPAPRAIPRYGDQRPGAGAARAGEPRRVPDQGDATTPGIYRILQLAQSQQFLDSAAEDDLRDRRRGAGRWTWRCRRRCRRRRAITR